MENAWFLSYETVYNILASWGSIQTVCYFWEQLIKLQYRLYKAMQIQTSCLTWAHLHIEITHIYTSWVWQLDQDYMG